MKIKLLASGQSPDYYEFNGEVITAHANGTTETYDMSSFPIGGAFTSADPVGGVPAIRNVERDDTGELHVTLCQQVGPGHWSESDWFDATSYDPDNVHVVIDINKPFSGLPWAKIRAGVGLPDYAYPLYASKFDEFVKNYEEGDL